MGKNLILDEIVSIKKIGKRKTYDFNMDSHCYFGNDFLVHNSDKVLIFWYECKRNHIKDNTDFKVIISKNKMGMTGYVDLKFKPEIYKFYEEIIKKKPEVKIHKHYQDIESQQDEVSWDD